MGYASSIPDHLNEDQMYRYLMAMIEKVFEKIQEKNPQLQLSDEDKKNLAQNITNIMLHDKNRSELSRDALEMNSLFVHKLTMALVMTATLGTEKNLNLFKKLDELFKSKDIQNENDLQKKLTPEELKQLKLLQDELRVLNKEILLELKALNLMQPKPDESGKKREKEFENTYDSNTNLLGLVNTKVAGGVPAVVQIFLGNLFGTPNQNPNYEASQSQLALQDKVDDTMFGDPLGLNQAAKENYESMGIEDLTDAIQSQYRHNEAMQLKP